MNKRIKKKREKLRVYSAGDRVYTHRGLTMFGKAHIGYANAIELYHKIENPKLTRPRVKALINYVYKDRMKRMVRNGGNWVPTYLRLARHLNEVNSATATPSPLGCTRCKPPIVEVD